MHKSDENYAWRFTGYPFLDGAIFGAAIIVRLMYIQMMIVVLQTMHKFFVDGLMIQQSLVEDTGF